VIGILVGLEIPLLMRILKERFELRELVANVLTLDYLGALGASLLFPLLLVPKLGLVRQRAAVRADQCRGRALVHVRVPGTSGKPDGAAHGLRSGAGPAAAGMVFAKDITDTADAALYSDEVIFARSTPYQRLVVTRWKEDYRLYLNGHLQFSSRDEYRYHESLVHPGLASLPGARRALVLGGGDGLAVRELLKYPGLESVTLVDLDPEMTRQFSTHPLLKSSELRRAHRPPREDHQRDAFPWLERSDEIFDFVAVDFPDPNNYSLGKLYTSAFYRLLRQHLSAGGLVAVQSTSPMFARQSYWCIVETMKAGGFRHTRITPMCRASGNGASCWGRSVSGRRRRRCPAAALSERSDDAGIAVRVSARPGPGAGGGEPPERPGAGPLLRSRNGARSRGEADAPGAGAGAGGFDAQRRAAHRGRVCAGERGAGAPVAGPRAN
jgi:spermidine synthase